MQDDALKTADQPAHSPQEEGHHPTVRAYIIIALILGVITLIEFGVFYLEFNRLLFILVFIALSGVKFAIVIMYYMHLKFDDILFSRLFLGGLVIAAAALFALLALFGLLNV